MLSFVLYHALAANYKPVVIEADLKPRAINSGQINFEQIFLLGLINIRGRKPVGVLYLLLALRLAAMRATLRSVLK